MDNAACTAPHAFAITSLHSIIDRNEEIGALNNGMAVFVANLGATVSSHEMHYASSTSLSGCAQFGEQAGKPFWAGIVEKETL